MISRGFATLRNNLHTILYPVSLDMITLTVGALLMGISMQPTQTLQLTLNPGLSLLNDLLADDNQFLSFTIDRGIHGVQGSSVLMFLSLLIVVVVISAFFHAGVIGLLYEGVQGNSTAFSTLALYGKAHFLRFIGLYVFITILLLLGTFFLSIFFTLGFLGFLIISILFLVLRILFIFLEFTIVTDKINVLNALTKSLDYFRQRVPGTLEVIFAMLVFNTVIAFILNNWAHPFTFLLLLVPYAYIIFGLQFSLMHALHDIQTKEIDSQENARV
ncbi:hypothetical protein [Texcoconibacillus texcoconensis]|uniref:Uncharacterized protein n=1 Tax=Texcoconibacillus texcoconensis TaxID=1095777 RepID=A0A840QRZ9_9BACI|nr:hypothetical protein [Texcoconibacillus texcoconensis]MBB5174272.1 hypothetical protein [Texcoconibacillus texcoconensis]